MTEIMQELKARGLLQDQTPELEALLAERPTFYLGVDPTADSLHIGHLLVYVTARRLVDAGLQPILLVGGGTGRIGDPKPDAERTLLDEETITKNTDALSRQVRHLLGTDVTVVDNYEWLGKIGLIDFLRDIGKHFTVNALMKKEAIAARLQSDVGLSYTEFAYPLLQARDYLELFQRYQCRLQIGGSDQWGNIVAGVDLIRRKLGETVGAFTVPLLVDPQTGKKFGKSEGNAVWLDPKKTTPFQFYQYLFNVSDALVEELLYKLTFVSLEDIAKLKVEAEAQPQTRPMQKALAEAVTAFVHGESAAAVAAQASAVLFTSEAEALLRTADAKLKEMLIAEVPSFAANTVPLDDGVALAVAVGLAKSKNEARDLLERGALKVFDRPLTAEGVQEADWAGDMLLLRRGKRQVAVVYR